MKVSSGANAASSPTKNAGIALQNSTYDRFRRQPQLWIAMAECPFLDPAAVVQ